MVHLLPVIKKFDHGSWITEINGKEDSYVELNSISGPQNDNKTYSFISNNIATQTTDGARFYLVNFLSELEWCWKYIFI